MAIFNCILPSLSAGIRCVSLPTAVRGLASGQKLIDVAINEKTGVSMVTMQRLPVNGLNLELLQEMASVLDGLQKDKCRGMILTSALPTIFSAGLDLFEMYKQNPERMRAFWTTLQDTWLKLYVTPYPTVAVVNGHSPAGGCILALGCEYRIMVGPKFTIGLNETQLGIIAPKWFMNPLANTIPRREAELALTTGRLYTTEEAFKVGLVDEVASDKADALVRTEAFFSRFTKIPARSRTHTKLLFRQETIDWLMKNRESDLEQFLQEVQQPAVQKSLGMYIESLKK